MPIKAYAYHKPTTEGLAKISDLREAFSSLHTLIESLAPNSRERSVALTNLETAGMWAIKAVVVNDLGSKVDVSSPQEVGIWRTTPQVGDRVNAFLFNSRQEILGTLDKYSPDNPVAVVDIGDSDQPNLITVQSNTIRRIIAQKDFPSADLHPHPSIAEGDRVSAWAPFGDKHVQGELFISSVLGSGPLWMVKDDAGTYHHVVAHSAVLVRKKDEEIKP